jgi:hypothetical protein
MHGREHCREKYRTVECFGRSESLQEANVHVLHGLLPEGWASWMTHQRESLCEKYRVVEYVGKADVLPGAEVHFLDELLPYPTSPSVLGMPALVSNLTEDMHSSACSGRLETFSFGPESRAGS